MKPVPSPAAAVVGTGEWRFRFTNRFTTAAGLAAAAAVIIVPSARADSVEAWGYNATAELGNGTTTNSPSPTQPIGLTNVTSVAVARNSTLAVQAGVLYGWGNNGNGQLGNGMTSNVNTTVPTPNILLTSVSAVSSNNLHTLVLQNSSLVSFGYNADGELGNGLTTQSNTPVAVTGMGVGVSTFSAGEFHSLAVKNGAVYAWGGEYGGELGDGMSSGAANPNPTAVAGLGSGVTAVAAGNETSFAIQNGGLFAWGANLSGQLGIGDATAGYFQTTPTAVPGFGSGVTSVATGAIASAAAFSLIAANGKVYVSGNNAYGEFGNGTSGSISDITSSTPVLVPGITGTITQVAADEASCFALSTDGSLWVWGANPYGELGLGTVSTGSPPAVLTPTQVFAPLGTVFTSVEASTLGDDTFATYAPSAAAPEPGTLALLGLGMISMRRTRRQRSQRTIAAKASSVPRSS